MKSKNLLIAGALALSTVMTPVVSAFTSMPVLAEEVATPHTIIITNPEKGGKYSAYQIFKGDTLPTTVDEKGNTVIYKNLANITWGDGISEDGKTAMQNKYDVTSAAEVAKALDSEAAARDFASAVNKYLVNPKDSVTEDGVTKITVSGDGYYLIKDETNSTTNNPTESILKVVNDREVSLKTTTAPDREKKVKENSKDVTNEDKNKLIKSDQMNDVADYNIGDVVSFELSAVAPDAKDINSYKNYKFTFHDKMDSGLTLQADTIKVYVGDSTTPLASDKYTLRTSNLTDKCTFEIDLDIKKDNEIVESRAGEVIRVTFDAKLNSSAAINKDGNENTFTLEYTNNPTTEGTGKTEEDKVVVFTYELDITKVDSTDEDLKLEGAVFKLGRNIKDADGNAVIEYLVVEADKRDGKYVAKTWDSTGSELTATKDAVTFEILGLDDGDYLLYETKAPKGYNTPDKPFNITLSADTNNTNTPDYVGTKTEFIGDITVNGEKGNSVNIKNTKGTELPETGGMGTTMMYSVGALMVGSAAVFFVTNKRTKRD